MSRNRIPRTIHYCWFGKGELPPLAIKCLDSWKRHLNDYEIVRWDEENFDITSNLFVKQAYENKKFAFVSDYVRLHALYNYGGIYMDTDVEVVKTIDKFLENEAFSGFETKDSIPTGIIGSIKGSKVIGELLDYYQEKSFVKEDGSLDTKTNVKIITEYFSHIGFKPNNEYQVLNGFTFYPKTFFCPLDWSKKTSEYSENTHTIHHFAGSWHDERQKRRKDSFFWKYSRNSIGRLIKIARTLLGNKLYEKIKRVIVK